MPEPVPRRCHTVPLPVSSVCVVGLPPSRLGSASRQWSAGNDFVRAGNLGAADIALCSGLPVCVPPRLSVPPRKRPQGSRGFYVRAEPASPLPQAPDMPTVRIQAIDSTGTFTLSDPQPGRLLISIPPVSTDSGRCGIPGENSSGTSMAHKELTMWISSDSLVIPRDQNSPQAPAYQRIRNGAFAGGRPARSPLGLRLPYPTTPQWRPLNWGAWRFPWCRFGSYQRDAPDAATGAAAGTALSAVTRCPASSSRERSLSWRSIDSVLRLIPRLLNLTWAGQYPRKNMPKYLHVRLPAQVHARYLGRFPKKWAVGEAKVVDFQRGHIRPLAMLQLAIVID